MDRKDRDGFYDTDDDRFYNNDQFYNMDHVTDPAISGQAWNIPDPKQIAKSEFSRIGIGLAAFLAVSQLSSLVFTVIALNYMPRLQLDAWTVIAANMIILYGLGLPVYYQITKDISTSDIPYRPLKKMTFLSFLGLLCCGYAGAYLSNIVTLALITGMSSVLGESFSNPLTEIMSEFSFPLLFYVVVLGPLMEEILFRKILLSRLRKYGDLFSITASALMFSLFHLNLFQMVYAFVLGCVFAYITLTYGKLRYSCFLHIIINGFGYSASMLATLEERYLAAFSLLLLVIVISGIVVFLRHRRTIHLQPGAVPLSNSDQFRLYFKSPGILILLFVSALLTAASLFGVL